MVTFFIVCVKPSVIKASGVGHRAPKLTEPRNTPVIWNWKYLLSISNDFFALMSNEENGAKKWLHLSNGTIVLRET